MRSPCGDHTGATADWFASRLGVDLTALIGTDRPRRRRNAWAYRVGGLFRREDESASTILGSLERDVEQPRGLLRVGDHMAVAVHAQVHSVDRDASDRPDAAQS